MLEKCPLINHDMRYHVICGLADAYTDLGCPHRAHKILEPEIKSFRSEARKGKPFRRLLVSAIDANVQLCQYESAETLVQELKPIFDEFSNLDVSDQLLHMRLLIALARTCQCKSKLLKALKEWEFVLSPVQSYNSFQREGYTYAVSYLSISLLQVHLGNSDEARKAFDCAARILGTGAQDFWIPTLVKWSDLVAKDIQSQTEWRLLDWNQGNDESATHQQFNTCPNS